ncbi:MAG: YidC/Oxa1 family membrane protein insertase [Candidatus Gracilibacteria bacterium]
MKKPNLLPYIFVFLATYLVLQFFKGGTVDPTLNSGDIALKTLKDAYAVGKDIRVEVQNNTAENYILKYPCTDTGSEEELLLPPFKVFKYEGEGFVEISSDHLPECTEDLLVTIEPGKKKNISLLNYSYSYFGELGRYKLELDTYDSPEFVIQEPGLMTKLWRTVIYQPILNTLVGLLIFIPGHYLGLAVILLTIIIRTVLLIPSQKAMKGQQRMQEVQPKLEALKKTHANDQARLAQETMLLWKTHKVNPLSSCLPLLIQLPILIALYSVVRAGLSPDRGLLIYDFMPSFSLHEMNPNFLGFNLLENSLIVFPIVIGALQFLQMHLMQAKQRKKKAATANATEEKPASSEMDMANKMMKYVMPVMIAVFTAQMPAAVGLYWGTSTFYGILQQLVVNKGGSKPQSPDDEVQIKVINKHHGKAN